MRARWTRAGMAHACNGHVRARKGICRRRQSSRQFASMRVVQVYGYGPISVAALRHGAFAMEACRTPCHSVGRASFSSSSLLAATYWVRSGRVQVAIAARSATLLVCTRRCQSLAKVPRFRAGIYANCMLWAVHGPRWSVSDFWWDLGPTAWNAVGSTLHLQQPYSQAAALRMVHRASRSALWALCHVPHTSLFSSCIMERRYPKYQHSRESG